jgi:hypothetical protein
VGVLVKGVEKLDSARRGNFYGLNFLDTPLWPNGFGLLADRVAPQQFAAFTGLGSLAGPFRTLLHPA